MPVICCQEPRSLRCQTALKADSAWGKAREINAHNALVLTSLTGEIHAGSCFSLLTILRGKHSLNFAGREVREHPDFIPQDQALTGLKPPQNFHLQRIQSSEGSIPPSAAFIPSAYPPQCRRARAPAASAIALDAGRTSQVLLSELLELAHMIFRNSRVPSLPSCH